MNPSISVDPASTPSIGPGLSHTPTTEPSTVPSESIEPSLTPSMMPTLSVSPSEKPSYVPTTSIGPSIKPSSTPSMSVHPSSVPSIVPSVSFTPTTEPSALPSVSVRPSLPPSLVPSESVAPIENPSYVPTQSVGPSRGPSMNPSISVDPVSTPSIGPGLSLPPTTEPSTLPSESIEPTLTPSMMPTLSVSPSEKPSYVPTTSIGPSIKPSSTPSISVHPSSVPSIGPSVSLTPTTAPSALPSVSVQPSLPPSMVPSESVAPIENPSYVPTQSVGPSRGPSMNPSISVDPAATPSIGPTLSLTPTTEPSTVPSESIEPSLTPSMMPTLSVSPSEKPSYVPTTSIGPSIEPSSTPSISVNPSFVPSFGARMETRKIVNLTNAWETVSLTGFISPIPICSVEYPNSNSPYHEPVLVRMQNVSSTSFEIRLQEPIPVEQTNTPPRSVHCLIVEKGTWKLPDNRTILAESYTSTVTDLGALSDPLASWIGEDQTASISSLAGPIVVLGQIMTYNDTRFSAFWSRGDTKNITATTGTFFAGKHVGADPQTSRNNEEIGYVVMERGHGIAYGIEFEAGVTPDDSVDGWFTVTGGYPHQYDEPFSTPPAVAIVSIATMIGFNGAWAALVGSPSSNNTHLDVTVDEEDMLGEYNRHHWAESVAYCSFASEGTIYLDIGP
eukprot:scaffold98355_cov39-Attheya_sp.AAC.1